MTQQRNGLKVGADGLTWRERAKQRDKEHRRPHRAKDQIRDAIRHEFRDVSFTPPPSPDLTAQQIIARLKEDFSLKSDYEKERKVVDFDIHLPGPIGILHYGDPHLDDSGTDWNQLESHMRLVNNTTGLFAGNIGDTTNNWIGRLGHLYSQQSTTAKQAWTLAEYFITEQRDKWIYHVTGNHDDWSGDACPIQRICKQNGLFVEQSEARIRLNFPNGRSSVINARHDFSGGSMWNPTHGPMKAVQLGVRDDIAICGHKHKSGYSPLKDPADGKVMHCLQVASYKVYDRYAREKGFRDQSLSPCVVTIFDPDATDPADFIQVFWRPERAAEYLTWLRGKG